MDIAKNTLKFLLQGAIIIPEVPLILIIQVVAMRVRYAAFTVRTKWV